MKQSENTPYTAEIWGNGQMIKVDLLDNYSAILATIINRFGLYFEVGELEGFDYLDMNEDFSLLELTRMAQFLHTHPNKKEAIRILNDSRGLELR